jgi:uncharacterized membrane protein YGL010W
MPTNSLLRPATDLLVQYAQYHRDRRNLATHFLGIPLIVFALGVLLARATLHAGDTPLSAAWAVWGVATLWYMTRGHLLLGAAVSLFNGLLIALAHPLATGSALAWLSWGVGCFLLGWLLQFLGHYYEGRKPAFVDDVANLLVGPMFIVAEWLFAQGWCRDLAAVIELRAGPTHLRDLHSPAA